MENRTDVCVIGAGFTGLAAAYELAKAGVKVTVLEADREVGGLASAFDIGGAMLDRFYHIWYTNDQDALGIVRELGLQDEIVTNPTNAAVYYANNFFKLASPMDLFRFRPLSVCDRARLGLLMMRARSLDKWESLEHRTAEEWLRQLGGDEVYRVVWQPLLRGKFGEYAEQISAVWFWNKLKLRSSSRGKQGEEKFLYLRGGFAVLAEALAARIRELGGGVELNATVSGIVPDGDVWRITTSDMTIEAKKVIATPALPIIADMVRGWASEDYIRRLERIRYLGNVCLILELDRSLTSSYWISVNDPRFPFVGIIEHTNIAQPSAYGGRHIVYLSKYMAPSNGLFTLPAEDYLGYAFPHLKTMFPAMEDSWIRGVHLWRSQWSQPIIEANYATLRPPEEGPREGLYVCSMAQIYPEDRGTNYAIRAGRNLARRIVQLI